jgi:hypothetical protein
MNIELQEDNIIYEVMSAHVIVDDRIAIQLVRVPITFTPSHHLDDQSKSTIIVTEM